MPTKVRKQKCETCPFREGSPYAYLRSDLEESALKVGSRICHSTGNNPVIKAVKTPALICRGARDFQLQFFVRLGFLNEATDAAWEKKRRSL